MQVEAGGCTFRVCAVAVATMLPVNEAPSDMRTLLYFMYGLLVRTCGGQHIDVTAAQARARSIEGFSQQWASCQAAVMP